MNRFDRLMHRLLAPRHDMPKVAGEWTPWRPTGVLGEEMRVRCGPEPDGIQDCDVEYRQVPFGSPNAIEVPIRTALIAIAVLAALIISGAGVTYQRAAQGNEVTQ